MSKTVAIAITAPLDRNLPESRVPSPESRGSR
jgi:hypothetical protein